jgi:predicted ATPase
MGRRWTADFAQRGGIIETGSERPRVGEGGLGDEPSSSTRSGGTMRIKRIEVQKLFGMFNHVIPFNLGDRITIMHGANGVGKTAILKMINGFFNARYSDLRSTPFSEFRIDFEDESAIIISKERVRPSEARKESDTSSEFAIEYRKPGEASRLDIIGTPIRPEDLGVPMRYFEDAIPGINRIAPDAWRVIQTGEILTLEELIENYYDYLPFHVYASEKLPLFERSTRGNPDWLKEIRAGLNVRFIETQRLVTMARPGRKSRHETAPTLTPAVARYSAELAALIQRTLAEYATLSQELDRSFPKRVVEQGPQAVRSIHQLREKLASLEERRARLRAAGVLDKETHPYFDFRIPSNVAETMTNVLSVYADDVEKKLNVFDEVARLIELLKQFIKDHFLNKELAVDKERGFYLYSTETKEELTPTQLSSGEQHELVLINELLFRTKPNSLFLIDEPEISLHVDWQLQFLEDLQNVIALSPFDVLLATHSPLIINQRWDLAVELAVKT